MIISLFFFFLLHVKYGNAASDQLSGVVRNGKWQLLLQNTGVVAMHMTLTHKNTVIIFDQTGAGPSKYRLRKGHHGKRCTGRHEDRIDASCYAHSVEYDIDQNKIRPLKLTTDTWCSTGSFLSNGTLLQAGGFGSGGRRIRELIPCSENDLIKCDWKQTKKLLSDSRWYASSQRLPDREGMIVVGGRGSLTYEFVPKLSDKEKSYELPFLHETDDGKPSENNLYPFLHLSSDSNLFIFANRDSILFNYRRNEVVKRFPRIPGFGSRNYPSSGSSVMFPLEHSNRFRTVEVMVCGGAAPGAFRAANKRRYIKGLSSCGRMVITGDRHKWKMEDMPRPRLLHDMLILPTGDILIINGAQTGSSGWENARNASRKPYLYKPQKAVGKRFINLKGTSIARMYHSSAILLPDGRVLVAGSNPHNRYTFHKVAYPTELRLEAFAPHYLDRRFHDWRPSNVTIQVGQGGGEASSPKGVRYGADFHVRFRLERKPNRVMHFTAYAPPFTTHSISMNQRMLRLRGKNMSRDVKTGWVSVILEAPPSPNVAPPGFYMVTVVNGGIPSISQWVQFAHNN